MNREVVANEVSSPDDTDLGRRELMLSICKFTSFVTPASMVLLDADTAFAKKNCSQHPRPRPLPRRGRCRRISVGELDAGSLNSDL